MNLLVLSSRPPWPPTRADQMTVDRFVRFLRERGHVIDLVCFVENAAEEEALRKGLGSICRRIETVLLPRWRSYCETGLSLLGRLPMQVAYFHSPAMQRLVGEMVSTGSYGLVYTHLIRMSEYSRGLALPKVLGIQISQALNYQRMAEHATDSLRRIFYRIEERKVRPYEVEITRHFDRVVLVGRRDVDELEKTASVPNAIVCPHGQDIPPIERIRSSHREPGAIVLSGVMATNTNVDAATWFAEEIFPLVEKRVPEAKFWIVGRNPRASVKALARSPKIVVTGEVDDVYGWLCRASVAVDPLRMGAGMQNKVIQAMACELPMVMTSVANEGINATDGQHALVRDDPTSFAEAVISLLQEEALRERIGREARSFVAANWTWEAHFERLHEQILSLARAA